jgi:hypothetical protein
LIYRKDKNLCNIENDPNMDYSLLNPLYTSLLIMSILFGYLFLLYLLKILNNVPVAGIVFRVLNIPIFKHVFGFVLIYIIYNLITASDGVKYCLNPPGIDKMSSKIVSTSVIFGINTLFYFILLLCKFYFNSFTIYEIL